MFADPNEISQEFHLTPPRPVIDPKTLKELHELGAETDPRLLLDMIELFFDTAPLLILTIGELQARKADEELAEQVHALKSLCGNFGAMIVVEKCQVIETMAKSGQSNFIAGEMESLKAEYARLETELKSLMAEEKMKVA
jgi:HPt (histidine-containing phosphotransfer) domain-containing protein